jgi:hypothetical protein
MRKICVKICTAAPLLLHVEKEMEDEALLSRAQNLEECDATKV